MLTGTGMIGSASGAKPARAPYRTALDIRALAIRALHDPRITRPNLIYQHLASGRRGYRDAIRNIVLHDVEGYNHVRIAKLIGLSEDESRNGLHQARLRMRELLAAMN